MSAVTADAPSYLCTVCDLLWDYHSVQHVACCPACGGGLLRATSQAQAAEATTPVAGTPECRR